MLATGSGGLKQFGYQMQRASAAGSDDGSTVPATGRLIGISARGLSVQVAVRYKRRGWYRRHIGATGYQGRIAGVSAQGLVGCRAVTVQVSRTAVRCQLPCSCSSCSRMRAIRSNRGAVTCQRTLPIIYRRRYQYCFQPRSQRQYGYPLYSHYNAAVALRPATGPVTQYQ